MSTDKIDDNDSQVQYHSGWSQDGTPGSFKNTLHGPSTAGATATLAFSGTGVEVHGVMRPSQQQQTLHFNLDKGSTTDFVSKSVNQQTSVTLFSSSNLGPGTHTLEITNGDFFGNPALWLDFFIVTSSQDPSPVPAPHSANPVSTTTPDDPTPKHEPSPTGSSPTSLTSTTSLTLTTSYASGTHSSRAASGSTLDTETGTTSSSSGGTSPTGRSPTTSHYSGSNVASASATEGSFTTMNPSTGSSALGYLSTPSGTDPKVPGATNPAHQAANHPKNVGAIVGGVIAALGVLLLLILALFVYRRRQRTSKRRVQAIFYPFTMDQEQARGGTSHVRRITAIGHGAPSTTVNPELLQVPLRSPSTNVQPPRRKPVPVIIPSTDIFVHSPSTALSRPVSSQPPMRQSVSAASVGTIDASRSSWHAI